MDKWEDHTPNTFMKIFSLNKYDPHKLVWKYSEEVRQLGIERMKKEAKAKEEMEKSEYIKNIQDTIYACKTLRSAGVGKPPTSRMPTQMKSHNA